MSELRVHPVSRIAGAWVSPQCWRIPATTCAAQWRSGWTKPQRRVCCLRSRPRSRPDRAMRPHATAESLGSHRSRLGLPLCARVLTEPEIMAPEDTGAPGPAILESALSDQTAKPHPRCAGSAAVLAPARRPHTILRCGVPACLRAASPKHYRPGWRTPLCHRHA